ncbi:MAG: hypothetical protein KO464_07615 [Candidatus Methanofastidiosum sp.]|nr:hypothetical protein [Methanofastidiosum sp.]
MPPHCDTLDGPVVVAAKIALEKGNVKYILPWVPKESEREVIDAFQKVLAAGKNGGEAKEVADLWFFETVVRLHRAGENAPYTGLKPAGLDEGPVIPLVEEAIKNGSPSELIDFLSEAINQEITNKFDLVIKKKNYDVNDVDAGRHFVHAFLGLTLYSHHLYGFIKERRQHKD